MDERFDAIIVGAGLGGLTAAARLLQEGLRVMVLESDPHPGGTAYAYSRKGFNFPMGPLGFSSPGVVGDVLRQVGAEDDLRLERVHYRLHAFGLEAPLSLPYGEMITTLAALFPREEAAISRFFGHMNSISSLRERLASEGSSRSRREESISGAAYLDRLIADWRLRRILGSMGSREPYSGITLLSAMWSLLCDQGIHYPEGGMRRLSDMLAASLGWEAAAGRDISGGETRFSRGSGILALRTQAAGIMLEDGRTVGVVLPDGTRLEAGAVISNADFKATLKALDKTLDARYQDS